jgi:hypothetical protein
MSTFPTHHRSHDYDLLIKEWKALAKHGGLKMKPFIRQGENVLHVITSPELKHDERETLYISTGVHGDESAPPWALLKWATENLKLLHTHRFLILPCVNPHGLMHNTRVDHRGVDINRTFHDLSDPLIAAWHKLVAGRTFTLALNLHEDYDAQGIYAYELNGEGQTVSREILEDCAHVLPLDGRAKIDGRKSDRGLIQPRRIPRDLPGMPEAIVLYQMGAMVTITFESPSEFSLEDRIAVQKKFIESSLHHVAKL